MGQRETFTPPPQRCTTGTDEMFDSIRGAKEGDGGEEGEEGQKEGWREWERERRENRKARLTLMCHVIRDKGENANGCRQKEGARVLYDKSEWMQMWQNKICEINSKELKERLALK